MKRRIYSFLTKSKHLTPDVSELFEEQDYRNQSAKRFIRDMYWLRIIIIVVFFAVVARLVKVQILDASMYQKQAESLHERLVTINAHRGKILDRNGNVVVSTVNYSSFVAYPKWLSVQHRNSIINGINNVLHIPKNELMVKLSDEKKYTVIASNVSPENAARVRKLKIPYLYEIDFPRRVYRYGSMGVQMIGLTNMRNEGCSGLEASFDSLLRGVDGEVLLQKVGKFKTAPRIDNPEVLPISGNDMTLTIDARIQLVVEDVLQNAVTKHNAEGGLGIVVNPRTGEVLAMAQYPFISPYAFDSTMIKDLKPRAITDTFEPGSVFKIVVSAGAIEYALVAPQRMFTAGRYYFAPYRRTPITDAHVYPALTFRRAFELSSNIVMAKISDIVGCERLYKTAINLGFGSATGIEIPGEVEGKISKPVYWSKTTLNVMAYGYEVSVTPLQILMAYSAIANGGELLQPYAVKEIVSPNGTILYEGKKHRIRKSVKSETARVLTEFLEGVVDSGTAKDSKVTDIRLAGKTGTVKKNIMRKYVNGRYQTIFVGFFPADNPQYAALIMIDDVKSAQYYASQTSAPAMKEIIEKISALLGTSRMNIAANVSMSAPSNLSEVRGQHQRDTQATMLNEILSDTLGRIFVPDVRGMSVLQAMTVLSSKKIGCIVDGYGIVKEQLPNAGTYVVPGTAIKIICNKEKLAGF
ncbi:MAG: PASTA domain-containing protein [Ignavibacteria bacterium]|nr:PASTA domain-containing protein [Ignavibacteria bacterium]